MSHFVKKYYFNENLYIKNKLHLYIYIQNWGNYTLKIIFELKTNSFEQIRIEFLLFLKNWHKNYFHS